MDFRVSVRVKCQMRYRDPIGQIVRYVCSRLEEQGESEVFGHQVISAFNEAFNNVVRHGGKEVDQKEVQVTVSVTDKQLIIEMEDDAEGFHPPRIPPKNSGIKESGMGLVIMRKFMDTLDYRTGAQDGPNTLTMVRNLTISPRYV